MFEGVTRRELFRVIGAQLGSVGAAALLMRSTAVSAEGVGQAQVADPLDWPEWRGRGRLGVWTENGILERFPDAGLAVRWRTPLRAGYSGPSVSGGRVFVGDFQTTKRPFGTERAVCLDEATGKVLWTQEWETNYAKLSDVWAIGPAATITVDGDRVYMQGRAGVLACLNAADGKIVWQKDYVKEYGTELPTWGMTGAPLVDGPRLICLVGGVPDAKIMAFDKLTGRELWRSLDSTSSEPGYGQPTIISAGRARQLIIWHPTALSSLNPETGKVYWEHPFKVGYGMTVATPVHYRDLLLVSCFYNGSMMLQLDDTKPAATVLWKGSSDSEIQTEALHALTATPVFDGDHLYGLCSYGQMRCLVARTGERVWESQAVTTERARWASGQIIRHGDRYFINNDRGDIIIARLTPKGYEEVSRTALIKPTSNPGNRRALSTVNWSHPAYANRHIYARNDEEIISASLAAASAGRPGGAA